MFLFPERDGSCQVYVNETGAAAGKSRGSLCPIIRRIILNANRAFVRWHSGFPHSFTKGFSCMKKSRFFSVLSAVILVAALTITVFSASAAGLRGDLDGNGRVSTAEARTILRAAVGLDKLTEEQEFIADMNGDEKITSTDARLALRVAVSLDEAQELPEPSDEVNTTDPTIPTLPTPSENPTEPTVVPEPTEPTPTETTEPEPTEPSEPDMEIDDSCYLKGTMFMPDTNGEMTEMSIESAHETYEDQVGVWPNQKTETLNRYFYRSADLFPGHDVGMISLESVNLLGNVTSDMYILNFDTKQYLGLNSSIAGEVGGGTGDEVDGLQGTAMAIPVYYSLDNLEVQNREFEGKEYPTVTTVDENGGETIVYLQKLEGRSFYEPALMESYDAAGNLLSRLVIDEYNPDPSGYFDPKAMGLDGEYYSSMAGMMLGIDYIMDFMNVLGML